MTAPKLFGTDGVRGIPGRPPLVPALVRKLGAAAGVVLRETAAGRAPLVAIGRDTRASGPALGRALAEGLAAAGVRALDLGVIPTPAVAYLTPRLGAIGGAVISASHNPAEYNGIKILARDGSKLSEALERRIEAGMNGGSRPVGPRPGLALARDSDAAAAYADFLRSSFPATASLEGWRIALDAANGAASRIAPAVLRGLGAEVFALGCRPDGANINAGCGALATGGLQREVLRRRACCGVALDGDADRALLVDERGRLLSGDHLIAFCALRLRESGRLRGGRVVVTVMANLGMIRFLESRGIGVVTVPVGDRNVTEALDAEGLVLGGESSGHIVFRDLGPTGDGILTALQALAAAVETGSRISRLRALYPVYPQLLRNIRVARRVPLEELPRFRARVRAAEKRLAGQGRVFVRYSGTEPLLRIMVEGPRRALVRALAEELAESFQSEVRT